MPHTKGPWHRGQGNGEGSVFADEGRMRLESGGTTLFPICSVVRGWDAAEDDANEALIAAAPKMLAALQAYVKELEEQCVALGWKSVEQYRKYHHNRDSYALALDAIAEATTV